MPVSLADEYENEKLFDFYAEFDISGQYFPLRLLYLPFLNALYSIGLFKLFYSVPSLCVLIC